MAVRTKYAVRRPRRPSVRAKPEITLLLSTYQKPDHLRRSLASIAMQEDVRGTMELIVTDDGSTDQTLRIVRDFTREAPFPVALTTHPHQSFQLARCRNEGVALARAPYLLFLDGDCLLPSDHVSHHLRHRQNAMAMAGYCCRLDEPTSHRIDVPAVRRGDYLGWIPRSELRSLALRDWKARYYTLIRHPSRPKLAGGNVGIWRADYERINGYDEAFEGWGGEDDDLRVRLGRIGVSVRSILRWTRSYHLWHPTDPSVPSSVQAGRNIGYLGRRGVLTRCRRGLVRRKWEDLDVRLAGRPDRPEMAEGRWGRKLPAPLDPDSSAAAEVELLFWPGSGGFGGRAECSVLVVLEGSPPRSLMRRADVVIADSTPALSAGQRAYHWSALLNALEEIG